MSLHGVIIVGGGGAGLMLARELGKKKHNVLILDRKKDLLDFSFYTLASFMEPKDFDLTNHVVAQEINKILLHSKRFKSILKSKLYTLDKKKLHAEILDSLDSNYVSIQLEVSIAEIKKNENGFTSVIDKEGNEYAAKIFVDATGTNGVLSKKVGLQEKKIEVATGVEYNVKYLGNPDEIHLLIGKIYQGGYGWIFPLKDGRGIIGFGTHHKEMIQGLKNQTEQDHRIAQYQKTG